MSNSAGFAFGHWILGISAINSRQ